MSKSVSISQIQTFMTCETKHAFVYRERLVKQYEETGPMRLGTVYHEIMSNLLEASYRKNTPSQHLNQLVDWTVKTWDAAHRPLNKTFEFEGIASAPDIEFYARWDETLETAKLLALLTLQQLDVMNRFEVLDTNSFLPQYRPDGDPVPLVEYKFSFPVEGTDYTFNGKVDAIVRDRSTGHIVVLDWKTKSSFIREDDELMNMQVGLYQYVMRQMGVDVTRGLLYQIKSGIRKPNLNKPDKKTGIAQMERRKNIVTTWGIYSDALIAAGLDPNEYDDMRQIIQAAEPDLFKPLDIYRSETYLANLWSQMKLHLARISDEDQPPSMALGFACAKCPFKILCRYRLEGWPIEDVIADQYIDLSVVETDEEEEMED